MRRREFITILGGSIACPIVAEAESEPDLIGLLLLGKPEAYNLSGLLQGLKDGGYIEGYNLKIEYRFGNDDPQRMAGLAADLVNYRVRLLVAVASGVAAKAAKDATRTIPVVFGFGIDPVEQGLVAAINRPGGNITGVTSLASELFGKQLSILHELLPGARRIGVLANPKGIQYRTVIRDTQAAAAKLGQTVEILDASRGEEIDMALGQAAGEKRVDALLIINEPIFIGEGARIALLAARYALPAIYPFRNMTIAGGLLSYGPDLADRDRETGHYVARILKGENPADMPVLQMSRFTLVINLKAARALGLTIPNALQLLADELIE